MKGLLEALPAERPVPAADAATTVAVSVVVPVSERPEELAELYREYSSPLRKAQIRFEFIFAVEPWCHQLTTSLHGLAHEPIRVLCANQALGDAALVRLAAAECRGGIVVTLPAYRRVEAQTLPTLIARVQEGADLAVARRWPRRDGLVNRIQTRAFHRLLAMLVGAKVHDVACGVAAMRRQLLLDIPLYGDSFRFLPLIASREGYRVVEVPAAQHDRDMPARVYNPGVYLRRLIDVLGLFFLLRFTEKPLRFFGLFGSLSAVAGFVVLAVLTLQRLGGRGIADRPLLLLGVLLVVLGVQAVALGLIGEIIVYLNASHRGSYRVLENDIES